MDKLHLFVLISPQEIEENIPVIHSFGSVAKQQLFNWPIILVITEDSEGFLLLRFDKEGAFAGDTWHETIEDAKDQADSEYFNHLGQWKPIPNNYDNLSSLVSKYTTAS